MLVVAEVVVVVDDPRVPERRIELRAIDSGVVDASRGTDEKGEVLRRCERANIVIALLDVATAAAAVVEVAAVAVVPEMGAGTVAATRRTDAATSRAAASTAAAATRPAAPTPPPPPPPINTDSPFVVVGSG